MDLNAKIQMLTAVLCRVHERATTRVGSAPSVCCTCTNWEADVKHVEAMANCNAFIPLTSIALCSLDLGATPTENSTRPLPPQSGRYLQGQAGSRQAAPQLKQPARSICCWSPQRESRSFPGKLSKMRRAGRGCLAQHQVECNIKELFKPRGLQKQKADQYG